MTSDVPAARALIDLELIERQCDAAQELVQTQQVAMEHGQFDLARLLVRDQAETGGGLVSLLMSGLA